MLGGNSVDVHINGDEDVSVVAAKAAAALESLKDRKIKVDIDFDKDKINQMKKDLAAVNKQAKDIGNNTGDFDLNTKKARDKLTLLERKLKNTSNQSISMDIDTQSAEDKLDRLHTKAGKFADTATKIELDAGPANSKLDRLLEKKNKFGDKEKPTKVEIDVDSANEKLNELKNSFTDFNEKIKIKIDVDIDNAIDEIEDLSLIINNLIDKTINIDVDTAGALAQIRAIDAALHGVDEHRQVEIDVDVNDVDLLRWQSELDALNRDKRRIQENPYELTIPAGIKVDDERIKELEQRIADKKNIIKVKTELDNSEIEEAGIKDRKVKIDVEINGLERLIALRAVIASLEDKTINIDINSNYRDINRLNNLKNGKIKPITQEVKLIEDDDKKSSKKTITQKVIQKITTEIDKKALKISTDRIKDLRNALDKRNEIDVEISKAKKSLNDLNDYASSKIFRDINYDRLVDDGKIRQLKKKLSSLNIQIDGANERDSFIYKFKKEKEAIEKIPVNVRTEFDKSKLKVLDRSLDELTRERRVFLELDDHAVLQAKKISNDIDNLSKKKSFGDNAKIQVDVDIAEAEAKLAALTRSRDVKIRPDISSSLLAKISRGISNVSDSTSRIGNGIRRSFDNDRSISRFARRASNTMSSVGNMLGSVTTPLFKGLAAVTSRIPVVGGLMRGIAGIGNPFAQAAVGAATLGVAAMAASGVAAAGIYAVYAGLGAVAGIAGIAGAAIGAGFVGGFAAVAAQSEQVKTAYSDLGTYVGDTMKIIAKPVEMPLVRAAEGLRGAFDIMRPSLDRIAQGTGDLIDNLTGKLPAIASSLGPALEKTFAAGSKHLSQFATKLPGIIDGVGKFMDKLGSEKTLAGAGKFFDKLPGLISGAGSAIEGLASGFSKMSDYFDSGALDPMINGFKNFADNLQNTDFSNLIGGISDMGNSFGEAVGKMDTQAVSDFLGGIASGTAKVASGTADVVSGVAKANSGIKSFSSDVSEAFDFNNKLAEAGDFSLWDKIKMNLAGKPVALVSQGFSDTINGALADIGLIEWEPEVEVKPSINQNGEQILGTMKKILPPALGGDPITIPVAPQIPPGVEMPLNTDGKPLEFPAVPSFKNLGSNTLPFLGDPIELPVNPKFNNTAPILPFLNDLHLPVYVEPIMPQVLPPNLGGKPLSVEVVPTLRDFNLPFLEKIEVPATVKWDFLAPVSPPAVEVPGRINFNEMNIPFIGKPIEIPGVIGSIALGAISVPPVPVEGQLKFSDLGLPFLSPIPIPGILEPITPGAPPPPVRIPGSIEFGEFGLPPMPPAPTYKIPSEITPPPPAAVPKPNPLRIPLIFDVQKPNIPKFPDTRSIHTVQVNADPLPSYPNTSSNHHVSVSADPLPSFPNTSSTHTISVVVKGGGPGAGEVGKSNPNAMPFGGPMAPAMSPLARGISPNSPIPMGASSMVRSSVGESAIFSAGQQIASSFASGIQSKLYLVDSSVAAIINATNALKTAFDTRKVALGLVDGTENSYGKVVDMTKKLSYDLAYANPLLFSNFSKGVRVKPYAVTVRTGSNAGTDIGKIELETKDFNSIIDKQLDGIGKLEKISLNGGANGMTTGLNPREYNGVIFDQLLGPQEQQIHYHYEYTNYFDAGLIGDPERQANIILDILEQSPNQRRIRKVGG